MTARVRRGRVPAMVALAGCALTMAGCGSGASAQTADLITPDQAKGVALSFLQRPTASAELKGEAGSLLLIEQGGLTINPPPSPEPTLDPSIAHNVVVWVAHQSSYPLSFLALDAPTVPGAQALPALLRFTKASGSAGWQADFQAILGQASAAPDLATDSHGYAQVIPPSRFSAFSVSPAQLGTDYAAYLQAANSTDAHEFAAGGYTSGVIDADNKVVRTVEQQKAATATVAFAPTRDAVSAYLLNNGGALVVVGIHSVTRVAATKGSVTVTKDGKGVAGPAPGKYHDYATEIVLLAALIDPPKGSTDKVSGLAAMSGPVRTTATPA